MNDDIVNDYIVTCDEEVASWIGNDVDSMKPIVRCKDCKFCDTFFVRYSDKPIFECLAEWCVGSEGDHPLVKPDGFCAWGERNGETE